MKNYEIARAGLSDEFSTNPDVAPVNLDKAWHAIHFLLTGDSRTTLLLSGSQVSDISEHCEVHMADDIRDLYESLRNRNVDDWMTGFNCQVFDDLKIYPGPGWTEELGARLIKPALQAFVDFVKVLTERNLGLMVVIC